MEAREQPPQLTRQPDDPLAAFLDASVWHGPLEPAEAILAAHPYIAASGIHAAAILGDDAAVRRFLSLDRAHATRAGPRGWDALTCLCFSKYLRLVPARSDAFVRAAAALLDAGASPNTGFYDTSHLPTPEFESALYGAAGVAHHAELTRLLLDRGADPNDGEVVYHTPETYDNGALMALVQTGRLTPDSLATMLLRKHDWHDLDGMRWLLAHGSDPNRMTRWGRIPLHHAILRDNPLEAIEALLDHGADPLLVSEGMSAIARAARRGRGDLLDLFERRGIPLALQGVERLLAACARNETDAVRNIAAREPVLVDQVRAAGGKLLAEFAGVGNTDGVRLAPRPRRGRRIALRGGRPLLGCGPRQHRPARRRLARPPRYRQTPARTRRPRGCAGRQGTHSSELCRARLRGLVLVGPALARIC